MKRTPSKIVLENKEYKIKRIKNDLYAIYKYINFGELEFFGYQSKSDIEEALWRGCWY